ncbi:hypothetical protein GCM10025873_23740 [Demequina sediminis]|nr:hypothetical protein GCM10025873_23740 [Demequina sediminis]
MVLGGDDARLGAREGLRGDALGADRHREQRHGDAFARGQQDVHLASVGGVRHLVREVDQLVRRVAHRGHRDDHVVSRAHRVRHAPSDAPQRLGIGDGRSAVLLHHKRHARLQEEMGGP